ncbi:unnamed protein product [Paramecium octaurelia]|uniref:Uncharacterized protein n=1 Tax=Paramecium octaurelia TaxID=43137 RepID=A0A8S1UFN6_PAROT|nr:unnamed protein product [Paramecium octaurelia]
MQTVSEQSLRKCNKIDNELDEIVNDKSNQFNMIESQIQYDLSKMNSNYLIKQDDDNSANSDCQQLDTLIQNNISNQQKDQQIQQLINSQTIQEASTNPKPFTYELIPKNSIKQNEHCHAIAVNKDYSTLIAACDKQIKVFGFKQGKLIQHEILNEHNRYVYTLNFMNRSDQFISGSGDSSIIIWKRNQNNSWICSQKLNGHTREVYCLILNYNEDLIVSGSVDNTIKFWQNQNEWLCSQTISDHTSYPYSLSFNEQQNKLISCGRDNLILVLEQQLNKQWMVIQTIVMEQFGLRLCFIDDNIFTCQPYNTEYMHVFEMNNANEQYTKTKDIPVKGGQDCWLFPQQYIRSKCILVNKNASNVTLISNQQNGQFIPEQSIQFGACDIFGCMTDDGQYLITWDSTSKEFQIRQYQKN